MKNKSAFLVLEYAILILVIIFSFWLFQQVVNSEVNFCRRLLGDLINARKSAVRHIDWENFRAMDVDVSASLSGLTPAQSQAYKLSFVRGFALGFKQATLLHPRGVTRFGDWRIHRKDADKIIVRCKHRLGTVLLFTVSQASRKLIGIDWDIPPPR